MNVHLAPPPPRPHLVPGLPSSMPPQLARVHSVCVRRVHVRRVRVRRVRVRAIARESTASTRSLSLSNRASPADLL